MTPTISILASQEYNAQEVLRLLQFAESDTGLKVAKDIENFREKNQRKHDVAASQISHGSDNVNALIEEMATCRELDRVLELVHTGFFNLERLNEKYNEIIVAQRQQEELEQMERQLAG